MTKDEVQAVIDAFVDEARSFDIEANKQADGGRHEMANLYLCRAGEKHDAARMLAEALVNSKLCPGCDHPKHGPVCMVGWDPYPTELAPEGAREREPGSGCNCHKVTR